MTKQVVQAFGELCFSQYDIKVTIKKQRLAKIGTILLF